MSSVGDFSNQKGMEENRPQVKNVPVKIAAVPTQEVFLAIQPAFTYINGEAVYTVDSVAAYEEVPMSYAKDKDNGQRSEEYKWMEECVTLEQLDRARDKHRLIERIIGYVQPRGG